MFPRYVTTNICSSGFKPARKDWVEGILEHPALRIQYSNTKHSLITYFTDNWIGYTNIKN